MHMEAHLQGKKKLAVLTAVLQGPGLPCDRHLSGPQQLAQLALSSPRPCRPLLEPLSATHTSQFRSILPAKHSVHSGKSALAWVCIFVPGNVICERAPEDRWTEQAYSAPASLFWKETACKIAVHRYWRRRHRKDACVYRARQYASLSEDRS